MKWQLKEPENLGENVRMRDFHGLQSVKEKREFIFILTQLWGSKTVPLLHTHTLSGAEYMYSGCLRCLNCWVHRSQTVRRRLAHRPPSQFFHLLSSCGTPNRILEKPLCCQSWFGALNYSCSVPKWRLVILKWWVVTQNRVMKSYCFFLVHCRYILKCLFTTGDIHLSSF